jgi:predicted acylesterase/phospholipase RssA
MSDVAAASGRVVLVLGGGGALGAYQAGALLALLERGVVPDAIYGASVGALNGAFLARDPSRRRAEQLARWWTSPQARAVLTPSRWNRLRGVAAALGGADALLDARPLRRMIDRHVGAHDVAELAVPLVVTTTCLDCGRPVHHGQGPIADVLAASCALPGLFPAVRLLDGHRHVDAGVLCGVPVRPAVEVAGPDDLVLVIDCALAPVTSLAGCAALSSDGARLAEGCTLGGPTAKGSYVPPVETYRGGVLQVVLDSFAVARAGASVADVGEHLADPRVLVAPHIADAWAAGHLDQLPKSPLDCSAIDALLAAGHATTGDWLDGARINRAAPGEPRSLVRSAEDNLR